MCPDPQPEALGARGPLAVVVTGHLLNGAPGFSTGRRQPYGVSAAAVTKRYRQGVSKE